MINKLTKYTVEELSCPKCGKIHPCKRYSVINVTEKPELKEDLLHNKLLVFHCDDCGLTAPLTYECVYVDTKKSLILYLAPEMTDNTKISLAMWEKVEAKQKRLVTNINDLKEKILIAENLLDDRIVELMKIENLEQLKKEMEGDELMNILFDYSGTNYYFMVFFEKKGMGRIPVSAQYYRDAEHRYIGHIGRKQPKGFEEIDMKWASNLLFKNKKS